VVESFVEESGYLFEEPHGRGGGAADADAFYGFSRAFFEPAVFNVRDIFDEITPRIGCAAYAVEYLAVRAFFSCNEYDAAVGERKILQFPVSARYLPADGVLENVARHLLLASHGGCDVYIAYGFPGTDALFGSGGKKRFETGFQFMEPGYVHGCLGDQRGFFSGIEIKKIFYFETSVIYSMSSGKIFCENSTLCKINTCKF
jgi:hypothetical protein